MAGLMLHRAVGSHVVLVQVPIEAGLAFALEMLEKLPFNFLQQVEAYEDVAAMNSTAVSVTTLRYRAPSYAIPWAVRRSL